MDRRLIILVLGMLLGMQAWSQTGLRIAELFDGSYKRKDNTIEVVVKGKELERYQLKVFRSLTIKNAPKDFLHVEKLVEQDGREAISKETGRIGNRLYYAFYAFPPHKGLFRYVFFRNSSLRKTEPNELTLVYMEGHVTMEELKMMFKK